MNMPVQLGLDEERELPDPREHLVVIGNGMAGCAVEELLARAPDAFRGTIFGAEALANYNRIMLSSVLAGEKSFDQIIINNHNWYQGGWIVKEVALRMGWPGAFAYDHPADSWREHARLTAYQNEGAPLLNLKAHVAIGSPAYDAMTPFQWGGTPFADGRFPTADGRARLVTVVQKPVSALLAAWPMMLNTGLAHAAV